MSRTQVLIVAAVGAGVFAASYAGGEAISEDEAAPANNPRATPLAPAVGPLQLGKGAPLPGVRPERRGRTRAVSAPVLPEPEPIEQPVETPAPPPSAPAPPAGGGGNSGGGGPVITFDDSG